MSAVDTNQSKRERVIEAAAAIFCQDGYAGASIDAVACRAKVSRQTIYNHVGDKEGLFTAVVAELTEKTSASFFKLLETLPDRPDDLEAEMTNFGTRLLQYMTHTKSSQWLLRLVQNEGRRYPELFEVWQEIGPARKRPALAARLAILAHGGYLDIADMGLAARQFMALITAEWTSEFQLGKVPDDDECRKMASNGVKTFLKAYGKR